MVLTEHRSQSGPCLAPGTASGHRDALEQEQKSRSQEPAPQSSLCSIETVQSVTPPSSQPWGQELKDCRRPSSRPTSASLLSSPKALDLGPTIDPLISGVERPFKEAESVGGLRSILTAQPWNNFEVREMGGGLRWDSSHHPVMGPEREGGWFSSSLQALLLSQNALPSLSELFEPLLSSQHMHLWALGLLIMALEACRKWMRPS